MRAQRPIRTVAPAELPVTRSEVKDHLRETYTDQDDLIDLFIAAAVEHLDGWAGVLGRALVTQTWAQSFDDFPAGHVLRLPLPDVQSVTVTYYDEGGVEQTLDADVYELGEDATGAFLHLADGRTWPTPDERIDAVTVTTVVGFGDAVDVPARIKTAIKIMVADLYGNRESVMVGSIAPPIDVPLTVDRLIAPYRRVGVS